MKTLQEVIAEANALFDRYDGVDAWREAEFGGTDVFDDYLALSLAGAANGYDPMTLLNGAISFGIVLERLRAQES